MSNEVVVTLRVVKEGGDTLKSFGDDLKSVGTTAKSNKTALDELSTSVTGMIAAYAGMKGIQLVGEMIALGDSANKAELTFRALSAQMGNYTSIMQGLRQATLGVVSDMDLQAGANKLMSMNLVDSQEQMEKFIQIATRLGGAMGKDAGESVDNFALMLSNTSLLRLDTYGISASAVRTRMNELKDTFPEMDKQARFLQATLEQGEIALNRLGDSALQAATPLDRLFTTANNRAQDFSQNVTTALNGIIGIIEFTAGATPQQIGRVNETNAQVTEIFKNTMQAMDITGDNLNPIAQFIDKAIVDVKNNPELANDAKALMDTVFTQMGTTPTQMMQEGNLAFGDMFSGMSNVEIFEQITIAALQYKNALDQVAASGTAAGQATSGVAGGLMSGLGSGAGATLPSWMMGGTTAGGSGYAVEGGVQTAMVEQRARREAQAAANAAWAAYYETWQSQMPSDSSSQAQMLFGMDQAQLQAAGQQAAQILHDGMIAQGNANQEFGTYMMTGQNVGDVRQYETRATADAYKDTYSQMAEDFQHLKDLNEQGFITDDELQKASDLKTQVGDLADQADRAADAFESMKLSDVFGQSGGGMAGEMSDMVLKQMKAAGKSDAEIAAAQQSMNLSSGRETALSTQFQSEIVPLLAGMNPEQMGQAIKNLQIFMQQAKLNQFTDAQIQQGMQMVLGYQAGGGQTFTVNPWGGSGTGAGSAGGMNPNAELWQKQLDSAQGSVDKLAAKQAAGIQLTDTEQKKLDKLRDDINHYSAALGAPSEGAAGGGGNSGSTLSEISAMTGIPVEQLLAATGASSARYVQPGTYSLGGSVGTGMDPMQALMTILQGGAATTTAGATAGAGFGVGMMGGTTGKGAGDGADSLANAMTGAAKAAAPLRATTGDIVNNISQAVGQMDVLVASLDAIPSSKTVTVSVIVDDPSGALNGGGASKPTMNNSAQTGGRFRAKND